MDGFIDPPRTVGSWPMITHSTPDTTPMPVTMLPPRAELRAPRGERGQLEEGAVAVEEQLDALPHEHPAPGPVTGGVALAAAGDGERLLRLEGRQAGEHGVAVGPEVGAGGVDDGLDDRHRPHHRNHATGRFKHHCRSPNPHSRMSKWRTWPRP